MATTESLITQIERVLAKFPRLEATWDPSNMSSGFTDTVLFASIQTECIALAKYVYGERHSQAKVIANTISGHTLYHLKHTEGMLRGTIEALRHGLLTELRTQVLLDIQAEFVEAGVRALEEGAKDVAAVLAAIVLEDATKRLADKVGLKKASNHEFSVVVVELLKTEAITKATKGILLGYKDLRNAALHAQWHEVSAESVRSLLQFLPQFMEQHGV